MIPDWLRPVLPRVAGAVVAALATWLAARFGIVIPQEDRAKLSEDLVVVMMLIFSVVYALTHKLVSMKANPADAASPKLAAAGKIQQHHEG